MVKKIKVYLQYPWKTSDSQYYKSIIDNPPNGFEIISPIKKMGNITNVKKFSKSNKVKKYVRQIAGFFNIPNLIIPSSKTSNADLIHCAHSLYLGNKPWVVDAEMYWSFAPSHKIAHSKTGKRRIKNILKGKSCKKIIAWTETAKRQIIDSLDDNEIKNKIEVVSYALHLNGKGKKTKNDINLLFLARYFYSKGGHQALKVMDFLTDKYENVYGTLIGEVPEEIMKKYSNNEKIRFFGLMPHEKIMKEIYPNSDIFIYPGFSDSFGFAIPEAMSFGLPVISVDRFSRKDLIDDGQTGFVVDFPEITYKINYVDGLDDGIPQIPNEKKVLNDMIKKTSKLIENPVLLKKMSENCLAEVKSGKFSIKRRNEKLSKIYREALK